MPERVRPEAPQGFGQVLGELCPAIIEPKLQGRVDSADALASLLRIFAQFATSQSIAVSRRSRPLPQDLHRGLVRIAHCRVRYLTHS